jgi:hypothetical protein
MSKIKKSHNKGHDIFGQFVFSVVASLMFCSLASAAVSSTAEVQCGQLMYPPNVLERGFRLDFIKETYDSDGSFPRLTNAAHRGFGLVNAMIPLNNVRADEEICYVGSPLSEFYDSGSAVVSRVDANLTAMRGHAHEKQVLILHQMMGTPKEADQGNTNGTELFTIDPNFLWNHAADDYAPLPIANEFEEFATALSGYFRNITQCDGLADSNTPDNVYVTPDPNNSGYPTIWIGTQEPEHTLGYTDDNGDGIGDDSPAKSNENNQRYIRFWSRVAKQIKENNPDARVGGIQQNGMEGVLDRYIIAANYWMEWEAQQGETFPIDYFTLQNYKTPADMPTIMANFRKGLTTSDNTGLRSHQQVRDRFCKTPVLFDRWRHYLDGDRSVEKDSAPGIVRFLCGERIIMDQPDVYGYCAEANGFERELGWMTADIGSFLVRMPAERRPISFSSTDLDGIAAGNGLGTYIVIWNKSTNRIHNLTLSLNDLVAEEGWATSDHLVVKRGRDGDYPDDMAQPILSDLGNDDYQITGITLYPETFVTIRWDADDINGNGPYSDERFTSFLSELQYAAHNIYCDRDVNSTGIPHGMGQYSHRTGCLTAAVNDSSGIGLAGAVFRQVPVSRMLNMYFSLENLPWNGDDATKLQMRIDYLQGDDVVKTVLLYPDNFVSADVGFWNSLNWNSIGGTIQTVNQSFGDAGELCWDIGGNAPESWAAAAANERGLMISLLLAGAPNAGSNPAMVRVRLGDDEMTYISEGEYDGYILELFQNSATGGTAVATGTKGAGLRIGDDADNKQYKSIVSFDTSTIPDWAVIDSAALLLKCGGEWGDASGFGAITADIKKGVWNGSVELEPEDFQALGGGANVVTLASYPSLDEWIEGNIITAKLDKINKTGRTQLRVHFKDVTTNSDLNRDVLCFYSGSNATNFNRPKLVVKYHH